MQKIISQNKKDLDYKLKGPIPFSESESAIDLEYEEKKYFSVVNLRSARRHRLFLNKHWDEEVIKWKGEKVAEYNSVLIINIPYDSSYCHNLIDTMPLVFHHESNKDYDLIIIANNKHTNTFISDLNVKFKKVGILSSEYHFKAKKIKVENYSMRSREIKRLDNFKKFLDFYKENILNLKNKKGNLLIYCTRNHGGGVSHGRLMKETNERNINKILKDYALEKKLKYVLFDGKKDGRSMTPKEQIELFHNAKMIVGPHGGAMANVIHIDPDNDCKICEFTSGTDTDDLKIQAIKPFVKNYNRLYNNMISNFSDYYFIPFLKSSTKKETEIDVKNLKFFLNTV